MKSDNKKLVLNASKDFVFSILALVIYNGVLQLLIYPGLETYLGADAFGTVLYLISAVSIMGAGFGTAASYSRMVAKKDRTQANGEYNLFLLIITALSIPVTLVVLYAIGSVTLSLFLQVFMLMAITVARYYADVEYRMNIRFKDYFIFFACVSAGYVVGLLLYPVSGSWALTILLGELFGIIYTYLRGSIFRKPYTEVSDSFKENMNSLFVISASNLLGALILHSDRLLSRLMVGATEVTVYYTASLIGKIVAMLTTPLNGVIISYLTNYNIKLDRKKFSLVSLFLLLLSVIGAFICTGMSYFYVKLMYSDVFEQASRYFFVANLGQILYFISGSLMVIILSFSKEKMQLFINVVYTVSFCVIVIPATYLFKLDGMAYGLVVVNLIRFIVTAVVGVKRLKINEKTTVS